MSSRFVERAAARAALRLGVIAAAAALAGACGSSQPTRAESAAPRVAEPELASAPSAEPARARSDRREERRAADEPSVDPAVAEAEPIPEAVQQGYDRALAALRAEDWLRAELELEQVTRDAPTYPGPFVNLAIVYRHDGRSSDARAAIERALSIAPENAAANNELGIFLRAEGKFDEAERAYRRALDTDPNYGLAHYNLAVLLDVYLRRGAEAIEHYEAYQRSLAEPDKTVAGWIVDLRRRFGAPAAEPRVAKESGE